MRLLYDKSNVTIDERRERCNGTVPVRWFCLSESRMRLERRLIEEGRDLDTELRSSVMEIKEDIFPMQRGREVRLFWSMAMYFRDCRPHREEGIEEEKELLAA